MKVFKLLVESELCMQVQSLYYSTGPYHPGGWNTPNLEGLSVNMYQSSRHNTGDSGMGSRHPNMGEGLGGHHMTGNTYEALFQCSETPTPVSPPATSPKTLPQAPNTGLIRRRYY